MQNEFLKKANQYIKDVLSGKIDVCRQVKQACQRQINDLKRQNTAEFPYHFDIERAEKPCKFVSRFKHTKGEWANTPIVLEPWQCFILTTLFGWVDDDGHRRFRVAKIFVPRKNGKSLLASAVGLYCFLADKEQAAEVYAAATTEKQALEVFRPAKQMIEGNPEIKNLFHVSCLAKSLNSSNRNSRFEVVVHTPGDGQSPSCCLCDEYHQHPTSIVIDTFKTGMGARTQGLMFIISTAGVNLSYPCKEEWDYLEQVLNGTVINEHEFGVIYTIDRDDKWDDFPRVWIKANPNYGVSVSEKFLKEQFNDACQRKSQQNAIKTKHLNVWCSSQESWLNIMKLEACRKPNLKMEDLIGKHCVMGLDLSQKIDLSALTILFWDENNYYSFQKSWLPRETLLLPENKHLLDWSNEGLITETPGAVIDYEYIKKDIIDLYGKLGCEGVCYDPWHCTQVATDLENEGILCIETRQVFQNLSEPMKELEGAIYAGKYFYNGDRFMTWQFANVVARLDTRGNIQPNKTTSANKIDNVVALILAMSYAIRHKIEAAEPGVFFI